MVFHSNKLVLTIKPVPRKRGGGGGIEYQRIHLQKHNEIDVLH